MLGQLDRVGADAPGAGVDEHFLTGLQIRSLDERLPGGQCDEGTEAASAMERLAGLMARSLPVSRAARRDRPPPRRDQTGLHRRAGGRHRRHRIAPRYNPCRGCSNKRVHRLRTDGRDAAARPGR